MWPHGSYSLHLLTVARGHSYSVHLQRNKLVILHTVYAEIFANFAICSYWRNFYRTNFLSCVNDYIEDMATFTALAKIYSTEYFCNTKVARLGEIFVH